MKIGSTVKSVLDEAKKGADQRKHPFHILNLAYKSEYAESCSVVLQEVLQDERLLRFHTHFSAPKVAAFQSDPKVSLMGYSRELKLQVRFKGRVHLHHMDELTKRVWSQMRDSSKHCYQLPAPGTALTDVGVSLSPDVMQDNLLKDPVIGYTSFMVCMLECEQIDVLELYHKGHQRRLYEWQEGQWGVSDIQA
ncbi:MAG: pyridoxamine 5'-phosphate oxidase family protein [Pseudomonadota bacterium]|nr:pyridoxamine 5'-phosphate oxidase family protein [Pseudomonadota bacterium]